MIFFRFVTHLYVYKCISTKHLGKIFLRTKYFVGQNFRRTKLFVGHNFRHLQKISSLLSDIFLSDKVCSYAKFASKSISTLPMEAEQDAVFKCGPEFWLSERKRRRIRLMFLQMMYWRVGRFNCIILYMKVWPYYSPPEEDT